MRSGFRISEFLRPDRFTVDLERGAFRAGLKAAAGCNRIVPIILTRAPLRPLTARSGRREDGLQARREHYVG